MIPQNTNNNVLEDLTESERDESLATDLRRMLIRMINELNEELKDNIEKQLND
jgi:hypothetical protein